MQLREIHMTAGLLTALAVAAGLAIPAAALAGDDYECGHAACAAARAEESRAAIGYDEATGRDLKNYPRDRVADYIHMRLDLDVPDMNVPRAAAVQRLTLEPIGKPLATLALDARLLRISAVSSPGNPLTHAHNDGVLTITFDPPIAPGTRTELVTEYEINDPPRGLTWTPEADAWPGRAAQIHTQGQAETNSYWFPCHDFPNEKLTTELNVTVPAGYVVSSNGRLLEQTRSAPGRETFRWLQDKPHVNYLVSLVIGKFDVVDVAEAVKPKARSGDPAAAAVPMPVYVPQGRAADVMRTYGRTPEMAALFAERFGEPYPWDRYAQLVVWNFGAGGMENTSATSMYDTAILSAQGHADGDLEGLISHELGHQWFGDLITCKSWEHIWLNEGFATYCSQLWFEHRDGRDAYLSGILGNFDAVRSGDHANAPYQWGMVRKVYDDPGQTFGGPASPYPKGSSILHMLRMRLGDDVFFRGIETYVDRYKFKSAETADLRKVMEEVSGEALERFFLQWCYRPGMPDLEIASEWDEKSGELVVSVKQTQNIDGDNPAFEFDLPVFIAQESLGRSTGPRSASRTETIRVRERETPARIKLDREPTMVAIDPDLHVLCRATIQQPLRRWIAQLERGPSVPARVQAARALAKVDSPLAASTLLRAAEDTSQHAKVRSEAILALKDRKDMAALGTLAGARIEPVDVRVTFVESIAELAAASPDNPDEQLKAVLVAHASTDTSFRARAAALKGLGKIKAADQLKLILAAVETPSQHDRVRQAALEALGDLSAPGTLPTVVRFAMPGSLNRTRPVAIAAIPKLAPQDPDTALRALALLLNDRERRAWEAAGSALVDLGDNRAIPALEEAAPRAADPQDKAAFEGWITSLRKGKGEQAASR